MQRYEVKKVILFGSYARSEATEASDVDFFIDNTDSKVQSYVVLHELRTELEDVLGKSVDLLTMGATYNPAGSNVTLMLREAIETEGILLFEQNYSEETRF